MWDKGLALALAVDTSKWRKEPKYVMRRNVVFSAVAALLLGLIVLVSQNLWWTAEGYCWGGFSECGGR
jgi:hypothetical protein